MKIFLRLFCLFGRCMVPAFGTLHFPGRYILGVCGRMMDVDVREKQKASEQQNRYYRRTGTQKRFYYHGADTLDFISRRNIFVK